MLINLLMISALVGQGLSFYKVYLFHIVLIIALFKKFELSSFHDFVKNQKALVFLFCFSALSLGWSLSIKDGVRDVAVIGMGVLLIYLVTSAKVSVQKLIQCILAVSWTNLGISLLESFGIIRYPLSLYSQMGEKFGKTFGGIDPQSVPTGFFYNPNNNAFFILIFTPIIVSSLRGWKLALYLLLSTFVVFMASSKLILLAWGILLLLLTVLFFQKKIGYLKSFSLLGILALGVGLLFYTSNDTRIKKYSKIYPAIKTFVILAPQNLIRRISGEEVQFDYKTFDMSLHERLTFIDGMADILNDKWLLGIGAGSLANLTAEQAGYKVKMNTPHFYLMELLTKFGVVFFLVYLFWLGKLFLFAHKTNKLYGLSLLMFIFFSPVMSSAMYFLPKWALYAFILKAKESDQ